METKRKNEKKKKRNINIYFKNGRSKNSPELATGNVDEQFVGTIIKVIEKKLK